MHLIRCGATVDHIFALLDVFMLTLDSIRFGLQFQEALHELARVDVADGRHLARRYSVILCAPFYELSSFWAV